MKPTFLRLFLGILLTTAYLRGAEPSIYDLAGKWEGGMEMGKFKFRMILRVVKTDDNRVTVKVDLPDQGTKGMKLGSLLYNHPDVRLEFDRFGAAFNGKVNDAGNEITGSFDEGPGGRPAEARFKRSTEADKPEPKRLYALAAGEAPDPRGYWHSTVEMFPGMNAEVSIKVARVEDGTYAVDLDNLDFGMTDVPGGNVKVDGRALTAEWQMFQATLNATLAQSGKVLEGEWKQGGRAVKIKFDRTDKPVTVVPDGLSFEPAAGKPGDAAGYWKGTLDAGPQKLRLQFRLGRAKDGAYAGAMNSLDQGGREMRLSEVAQTEDKVTLRLKLMQASFEGTVSKDGKTLEGHWSQGPGKMPLKLSRISRKELENQD